MENSSKSAGFAYPAIQVLTLLGGGLFCFAMSQFTYSDFGPSGQLTWGLIQCLEVLSGLGFVAALLSFIKPAVGRTLLRGFYMFCFFIIAVSGGFYLQDILKKDSSNCLAILAQLLLILVLLAATIKTLAPPKEEQVYREI